MSVPQNIGGFYSAKYNRCFLVGGIDERIKSPDNLKKELDSMKVRLHGVRLRRGGWTD